MRISVVINTFNRAKSLIATLDALELQTHDDFEVVVVNGPSTDGTAELLSSRADRIRTVQIDVRNLSVSRNVGIDHAAGELVAFIDDDAVPFPTWLEELEAPFADPEVVGTGGLVHGPDGTELQYRYSLCDRVGRTSFPDTPPEPWATKPHADPFIYLQGTNMCFRRTALVEAGGFDEEIEYNYDEVDLCLRLIDRGGRLVPLDGAPVIHGYLESHLRDSGSEVVNPFPAIKNRYYFSFVHGLPSGRSVGEVAQIVEEYVSDIATYQDGRVRAGRLDPDQYLRLAELSARAASVGLAAGLRGRDDGRVIAPAPTAEFRRLPTRPAEQPRRWVFVSIEYPPASMGGIGRFTHDLARGFAGRGDEVHVITAGDEDRLALREGVWVHEIQPLPPFAELPGRPGDHLVRRAFAVHRTVERIRDQFGPVDLVSAPLWSSEGLVLSADPGYPTVTSLMTTMRTIRDLHPEWAPGSVDDHLALEGAALDGAGHLHAISEAILEGVREQYPEQTAGTPAFVAHLGVEDRRDGVVPPPADDDRPARILFVGRLEHRKGVDLLLTAAAQLTREGVPFELHLVGKDTPNTGIGRTYREWFDEELVRELPELRDRVTFLGEVDEDELLAAYAGADLFCGPSRYESLGLTHVEAAMMGLPVVGSAIGGMREVVRDGETGLLVTPDDAEALAGALRELLQDAGRRRALGEAGRRHFEEHWSNDAAVTRTSEMYVRVAEAHEGSGALADEAVREALAARIAGALGIPADDAEAIVAFGVGLETDEVPGAIRRAWAGAPEALVRAAFDQLLQRPAGDDEVAAWAEKLRTTGMPSGELLNEIAASGEARAKGPRAEWLAAMVGTRGWSVEDALRAAGRNTDHETWAIEVADAWLGTAVPAEERREYAEALAAAAATTGREAAVTRVAPPVAQDPAGRTLAEALEAAQRTPAADSATTAAPASGAVVPARRQLRPRLRSAVQAGPTLYRRVGGISAAVGRLETRAAEAVAVNRAVERLESNTHGLPDAVGRLVERAEEGRWGIREVLRRLASSHAEEVGMLRRAQSGQDGLRSSVAQLQQELGRVTDILGVLHSKHVALAMDVRELHADRGGSGTQVEPEIVDPAALEATPLKVNVGCGEKPLPDYVNVDARRLPDVAVVADAKHLPFDDGSVDELMSSHLVEHFREHELRRTVLPHWVSKLRPGGTLRVICPDWEHMLQRRADREMSWADFKTVTFGQQDYVGDDHFAMYSPATLRDVLADVGLVEIETIATARRNGLSSEMELVARRPLDPQD